MAVEKDHVVTLSLTAASDMSFATAQFCFVTMPTSGTGDTCHLCTATTDMPIGVLQNRPARGEVAEVLCVGVTKLRANADLSSIGGLLGTSASARAAALTTASSGAFPVARLISIDNADNDGRLVTALLLPALAPIS